jgi:hypothetical protein
MGSIDFIANAMPRNPFRLYNLLWLLKTIDPKWKRLLSIPYPTPIGTVQP